MLDPQRLLNGVPIDDLLLAGRHYFLVLFFFRVTACLADPVRFLPTSAFSCVLAATHFLLTSHSETFLESPTRLTLWPLQ